MPGEVSEADLEMVHRILREGDRLTPTTEYRLQLAKWGARNIMFIGLPYPIDIAFQRLQAVAETKGSRNSHLSEQF